MDELPLISDRAYETVRLIAPELSRVIVKEVFQQEKPFYCEEYPNVRFHLPYDIVVQRKSEFGKFYWNGKVTPHGPHHDSWYQCPINCINIWIAIGSVKIGNGLNIYPQVYGKRLPCTKDGKILSNQYFSSIINFELKPGDALIFHGEHLHSSEINSTDATRYVVSLRMTLEKPQFLEQSPYKDNYIYHHPNNELKARLTELLKGISRRLRKQINSALGKQENQNYIISELAREKFDDASANFPKPIPLKTGEKISLDETKLVFDSSDLPIGTIRPISQKMCVARLKNHQVVAFSRYCPHEEADLAGGHLRDGCIICPWHNLPLSLENGSSPCQSLSPLTIWKCIEDSDKVEIQS
ncbi:Rieske 2Fe-2S domain-containing protein [Pleurocapsales cyanobacterium LEGE 06147]|nr:Rieske 2Fe-2S domain-containing protein [Pleurocapsales cyanobacterium LEGE 06147]